VNEDEHGITPPNVTAMTIEPQGGDWLITVEQGNGDVIKQVSLTEMERLQLASLLEFDYNTPPCTQHLSFVDFTR